MSASYQELPEERLEDLVQELVGSLASIERLVPKRLPVTDENDLFHDEGKEHEKKRSQATGRWDRMHNTTREHAQR